MIDTKPVLNQASSNIRNQTSDKENNRRSAVFPKFELAPTEKALVGKTLDDWTGKVLVWKTSEDEALVRKTSEDEALRRKILLISTIAFAIIGGGIGALVGHFVPVVGIIAGPVAGAYLGAAFGLIIGEKIASAIIRRRDSAKKGNEIVPEHINNRPINDRDSAKKGNEIVSEHINNGLDGDSTSGEESYHSVIEHDEGFDSNDEGVNTNPFDENVKVDTNPYFVQIIKNDLDLIH